MLEAIEEIVGNDCRKKPTSNEFKCVDLDEHGELMAERFLRIKNRIKLIPDEIQAIAPVAIRSQFRADIGIFVKELLLEMDSWKFKADDDNHWFDGIVGCAVAASMQ